MYIAAVFPSPEWSPGSHFGMSHLASLISFSLEHFLLILGLPWHWPCRRVQSRDFIKQSSVWVSLRFLHSQVALSISGEETAGVKSSFLYISSGGWKTRLSCWWHSLYWLGWRGVYCVSSLQSDHFSLYISSNWSMWRHCKAGYVFFPQETCINDLSALWWIMQVAISLMMAV